MLSVSLSRLVVDCTVLFLEGSATIRANFEFQDCYLQHSKDTTFMFRFCMLLAAVFRHSDREAIRSTFKLLHQNRTSA